MKPYVSMRNFLTTTLLLLVQPAWAEVMIIVNPSNPISNLSVEQIEQLFLGDSTTFPNGASATPVAMRANAVRDEFLAKVLEKSAGQVKAAWSKLVFSGKGIPPRELSDPAEVKAFVAANPTAIGYVDKAQADASVKVVFSAP